MRTRNHRVVFYLNDKEFEAFEQKAKRSSRSREAFIRKAIQEVQIKELPPADLYKLIWEIRRVGNNIDQILMIANAKGILNIPDLCKAIDDLREVEKLIVSQYI
ncbi:MAG: ribbon-helix-helix protein, CopG family [Oscillospiraceae bacterium]|nr:ribbon-helix-helix protein, CopG family [Oscillospiraceae bacterium]